MKINTKIILIYGILVFLFATSLSGCGDENSKPPVTEQGKIIFNFKHKINGQPIIFDTLMYTNAAGNKYMVNEIQYFITDVTLYKKGGGEKIINEWQEIYYVDTDLENTWKWEVYDDIAPGDYDSISFIFGIPDEKNISFMYVNPPERDMFWPEYLGGGYHYMKLNGKWLEDGQTWQTTPFDFHLGRGQIYYSYPDSITGFIDNSFRVSLPASAFSVSSGQTKNIEIDMNVENWFKDPHIFDLDVYGGYIMQNQEAMEIAKENGHNVFSVHMLN